MITPIKYIVYRVLPLVYDDSLSYLELVSKVVAKTNEVIENMNKLNEVFENTTKYIEEIAKTVVKETVTPEYVRSIITETYLNEWLEDSPVIDIIENDIATLKTTNTSFAQQIGVINTAIADMDATLNTKAPIASPSFTGTPTAPTPENDDNSTKLATTAFVKNIIGHKFDTISKTLQNEDLNIGIYFYRNGDVVECEIYNNIALTQNSYTFICDIPEGFVPRFPRINIPTIFMASSQIIGEGIWDINKSAKTIRLFSNYTGSPVVALSASWLTGDTFPTA